jgi:hypothetical protein
MSAPGGEVEATPDPTDAELEEYAVIDEETLPTKKTRRFGSKRRKNGFIPSWSDDILAKLNTVHHQAEKVVTVAQVLWKLYWMGEGGTVLLSTVAVKKFGVSRPAKIKALEAMEGIGLVRVAWGVPGSPPVDIVDPDFWQGD